MAYTSLLCIAVVVLTYISQVESVGYCPSYCDPSGYYYEAFHCHPPNIYCCGTNFHRQCCSNHTEDITSYYPDKYNCNTTTWMQVHWQVMITMTGSLLLILLFTACCCQCCRLCSERAMRADPLVRFASGSSNVTAIVTDHEGNQYVAESSSDVNADGGQVTIQMFDPDSPYAFTPPEYESLPKDPPKYNDLINVPEGGALNPCYVPDTPPPPFSEEDEAMSPPLPVPSDENVATMEEMSHDEVACDENAPTAGTSLANNSNVIDNTVVVGSGFVDVELSVDTTDDPERPLTEAQPPEQEVGEEDREHCLSEERQNLDT